MTPSKNHHRRGGRDRTNTTGSSSKASTTSSAASHYSPTTSAASSTSPRMGLQRDYSVLEFQSDETVVSRKTIGLFGAETKTGQHFLRAALDAGYHVQALMLPNVPTAIGGTDYPNLEWVPGHSLYDTKAMARVVQDVHYVVCMSNAHESAGSAMNDPNGPCYKHSPPPIHDPAAAIDPSKPIASFLQVLYPILKQESSLRVFLFQANSLVSDTKGRTPVFSKVLKSARLAGSIANNVLRNRSNHQQNHNTNSSTNGSPDTLVDLDSCMHEIASHHKRSASANPLQRATFAYIVTRPTNFLQDGISQGKVAASKSQPGVFPIRHVDLAVFSLNCLLKKRLYNSCPYVVADRF